MNEINKIGVDMMERMFLALLLSIITIMGIFLLMSVLFYVMWLVGDIKGFIVIIVGFLLLSIIWYLKLG